MSAEGGGLRGQWRLLAAVGAVATVGAFVGVRVAGAVTPGARGGPTRTALAVAGTLTGVAGATARATFVFRNAGGVRCTPPEVSVRLEAGGGFREEIDLTDCSAALFDGSDVSVDVQVNGANVITGQPIAPVPYARYAEQYGTPDCPVGYERDVADPSFVGDMRLCKRFRGTGATRALIDEVVRVGTGASAFWIDRYEASAVEVLRDGSENTRFAGSDDIGGLPRNGQWRTLTQVTPPTFARSTPAVTPARWITWFQAQEACRASGKRLPTGEEWVAAAQGTPDPPTAADGMGVDGRCLTAIGGPRVTGGRAATRGAIGCQSAWGAEDMIGNVNEWTADWQSAPGDGGVDVRGTWTAGDGTYNVASAANVGGSAAAILGIPSAVYRGGNYGDRERAGVFSYGVSNAASSWSETLGFRCVIPR